MEAKSETPAQQSVYRLRDPLHLRWALGVAMMICGIGAIHWPSTSYREKLIRELALERTRLELATEVHTLRQELKNYEAAIPKTGNIDEWRGYILERLAGTDLYLVSLEPNKKQQQLGPYKVLQLRVELRGSYQALDQFLEWLEANERLVRVENLSITPDRTLSEVLNSQLTITSLTG